MTSSSRKAKDSEDLKTFVVEAINSLMEGQVSETLILSSHKINTTLSQKFGVNFKIDRIGRCLAKFARENELKRLSTKIPKYEVKKSQLQKKLAEISLSPSPSSSV